MYVIIVGGGNVGYYLAKTLAAARHEVLLLEKDRAALPHHLRRAGRGRDAGRRLRGRAADAGRVSGAPMR